MRQREHEVRTAHAQRNQSDYQYVVRQQEYERVVGERKMRARDSQLTEIYMMHEAEARSMGESYANQRRNQYLAEWRAGVYRSGTRFHRPADHMEGGRRA